MGTQLVVSANRVDDRCAPASGKNRHGPVGARNVRFLDSSCPTAQFSGTARALSGLPALLFVTVMVTELIFSCQVIGQEAPQEVTVEVADEIGTEVVEDVAEEVVAEEEVVEDMMVMPADNNMLKLFAHAAVEVALVRRTCELTEEQQKSLAEIDNNWVRKISNERKQANANVNARPGLIAMFFGARPVANPRAVSKADVKTQIEKRIAELLTDQQKQAYEKEKQLRAKFRSEAIADALLESLHARLGLTDQQRQEIKAKVSPWAKRMNIHTMYYFSGNNYFPDIPEHLLSALDKDQMEAYRGLRRHLFTDENFNDGQAPIVIKQ